MVQSYTYRNAYEWLQIKHKNEKERERERERDNTNKSSILFCLSCRLGVGTSAKCIPNEVNEETCIKYKEKTTTTTTKQKT